MGIISLLCHNIITKYQQNLKNPTFYKRHLFLINSMYGQNSSDIGVRTIDIIPNPIRAKVDTIGIRDYFGKMSKKGLTLSLEVVYASLGWGIRVSNSSPLSSHPRESLESLHADSITL